MTMTPKLNWTGYCSATITKADGTKKQLAKFARNELVNGGRDWMHNQVYIETAANTTEGSHFVAVSTTSLSLPALSDTTLTGEVTDRGCARATASPAASHSAGTNSSTVEKTFTVSGAGFTDPGIQSSGLFNASTSGTMTHHANFSTASGVLAANDTLKVTWTLNLG